MHSKESSGESAGLFSLVFTVLFIRLVVPSLKVLGLETPSACPAPLDPGGKRTNAAGWLIGTARRF